MGIGVSDMKRFLGLAILFTSVSVMAILPEHVPLTLERLNVERIKGFADHYQQQIRRSDICKKALLITGGAVAIGGIAWLCKKHFYNNDTNTSGATAHDVLPAVSDEQYRRVLLSGTNHLPLWDRLVRAVNKGVEIAVCSFIGAVALGALSSAWQKAGQVFGLSSSLFSSKEDIKEREQVVSVIGRSLSDIIPEYEQTCSHALKLGLDDAVAVSFVNFLEHEIVKQHAAFIRSLEEAIAFLSELQLYKSKENKASMNAFDEQVMGFVGVLDSYTDALERMLNAPLDTNKPELCTRVMLISTQFYNQADRFVAGCSSLALEA